jgi:hypothetical protein
MKSFRILLFLLFFPPLVRAGEPACADPANAGLHFAIVDNRFDLYWCGPSPIGNIGASEVKSFVHRPEKRTLIATFSEPQSSGREVSVNFSGAHAEIIARSRADKSQASLVQDEDGAVLTLPGGEAVRAKSFHELVRQHTADVQVNVLRALSDLGAVFDPSPDLPVVMALAASGYSQPDPAMLESVTKLTSELTAADVAARDKAQAALIRIFPLAIKQISELAKTSADPEAKTRLEAVIAAHPGIARARTYVEQQGLQNDRKYVQGLVNEVPLLREAARVRLKMLDDKRE